MEDFEPYDYYGMIAKKEKVMVSVINQIYDVLDENIRLVRYIDKKERENMASFIVGLNTFLKHLSKSSNADKCVKILLLRDHKTNLISSASQKDVDKAAKLIQNGGSRTLSKSAKLTLLHNVVNKGVKRAVGSDAKKISFVSEIMGEYDEKFVQDVLNKYYFDYPQKMTSGTTIQELCTDSFIDIYEETIFNDIIHKYTNNFAFKGYFTDIFTSIYEEIYNAVIPVIPDITYIRSSNSSNAITALKGLKEYGVKVKDIVEYKIKLMIDDECMGLVVPLGHEIVIAETVDIDEIINYLTKENLITSYIPILDEKLTIYTVSTSAMNLSMAPLLLAKLDWMLFIAGLVVTGLNYVLNKFIEFIITEKNNGKTRIGFEYTLIYKIPVSDPTATPKYELVDTKYYSK